MATPRRCAPSCASELRAGEAPSARAAAQPSLAAPSPPLLRAVAPPPSLATPSPRRPALPRAAASPCPPARARAASPFATSPAPAMRGTGRSDGCSGGSAVWSCYHESLLLLLRAPAQPLAQHAPAAVAGECGNEARRWPVGNGRVSMAGMRLHLAPWQLRRFPVREEKRKGGERRREREKKRREGKGRKKAGAGRGSDGLVRQRPAAAAAVLLQRCGWSWGGWGGR